MDKFFDYNFTWIDINGYEFGSFEDDIEVMKYLVALRGKDVFFMASERLQSDKEFVLFSIRRDPSIWMELNFYCNMYDDLDFIYDKDIVLTVIKHKNFLPMLDSYLESDDYDFYDTIFNKNRLKYDRDILTAIAEVDSEALKDYDEFDHLNKRTIMAIVNKCGSLLGYVPDEYKDNEEIVIEAISNDIHAFKYASSRLRFDKKIVAYAINSIIYRMCNEKIDIKDELNEIMSYTNKQGLKYIDNYLKNNLNDDICFVKMKIKKEG